MNKLNEDLEKAIGYSLGTEEVHIMQISPAFNPPTIRVTASWNIPLDLTALHREHGGIVESLGKLVRAISDKVSVGAIEEARHEIGVLNFKVKDSMKLLII